jgi:hypothetical protein
VAVFYNHILLKCKSGRFHRNLRLCLIIISYTEAAIFFHLFFIEIFAEYFISAFAVWIFPAAFSNRPFDEMTLKFRELSGLWITVITPTEETPIAWRQQDVTQWVVPVSSRRHFLTLHTHICHRPQDALASLWLFCDSPNLGTRLFIREWR